MWAYVCCRWNTVQLLHSLVDMLMMSTTYHGIPLIPNFSALPVRKIDGSCSGMLGVRALAILHLTQYFMNYAFRKSICTTNRFKGIPCPDKLLTRRTITTVHVCWASAVLYDVWKRERIWQRTMDFVRKRRGMHFCLICSVALLTADELAYCGLNRNVQPCRRWRCHDTPSRTHHSHHGLPFPHGA
jgi:hypothetical protein